MRKKVVVLVADGFEEIEGVTTIDILRRAGLDVTVAGVGKLIIKGSRGITVKADVKLSSYKGLPDAIVLPGGMPGVQNLARSGRVNNLILEAYKERRIIAAICAAPSYVLAPIGILNGKRATCYPGCEGLLKRRAKFIKRNVVVDGTIITSKGPGTAFDFALMLVEKLRGRSISEAVRKKILYERAKK